MENKKEIIRMIDIDLNNTANFTQQYIGCLVLTSEDKILLQKRGDDWNHFPGLLSAFGGRIEKNETPMQTLISELQEELGAKVIENEVVFLGAVTEAATQYTELVYEYFWHDKDNSITGCYEGEAACYDNVESILHCPNLMDDVRWMLAQCKHRCLL